MQEGGGTFFLIIFKKLCKAWIQIPVRRFLEINILLPFPDRGGGSQKVGSVRYRIFINSQVFYLIRIHFWALGSGQKHGSYRIRNTTQSSRESLVISGLILVGRGCVHGIYIRWYLINRCARKEQSLLFDLYKAFD